MKSDKILIVDDEPTTTTILSKSLTTQGFNVITANSAIAGAELLKKDSFAIVITDINMPEVTGLDFLLWIKEHSPNSKVALMTAFTSDEIKDFANSKGVLKYFEKPVNLNDLYSFVRSSIVKGFTGNISEISLFDFLQVILLSSNKKQISVSNPETEERGHIYLKDGSIIHAEFMGLEAEEALFAMLKIKNGTFKDMNWSDPGKRSINAHHTLLLMEAAKVIDENNVPADGKLKILIVDDDPLTPLILDKYLSGKGFAVTTSGSAVLGAELMKKEFFNLVISDLNMPEVNGFEFLLWIRQNSPKSQVIIITAYGSDEIHKFSNQKGALNYLEKPVNLKSLEAIIRKTFADKGFSGQIRDIDLIDFIQIIAISRHNKIISVIDPVMGMEGLIYINDGNIIHAEAGGMKGREAFSSILRMKNGIFSDLVWVEPKEVTINTPLPSLIMQTVNNISPSESDSKEANETALVRAMPKYLERALAQKSALEKLKKEEDLTGQMTIYESGVIMGIVIGKSTKEEVISMMKKYSSSDVRSQKENQMIIFDDISFNILFNEIDIADEFNFGQFYTGKTSLGISIGDTIEKAIEVYGKPKTCTIKGAVWETIAFFCQDNKRISAIRIRNSSFFDSNQTNYGTLVKRKIMDNPSSDKLAEALTKKNG